MFEFDQKSKLLLEEKNLTFRHNHFLDLSEFRDFDKGFNGEIFHLSDEKFNCYISQVLTNNIKLGLYQHNCRLLYKGASQNRFTFSLSAFHHGTLYCHKYKIDTNIIAIVYPHQEIAALRQNFHGSYVIVFEEEFLNHLCETLELSELKKQLDDQRIPQVLKVDRQNINYIRRFCYQIYRLLFHLAAQPNSSTYLLLINHYLKQKIEEVAKYLIITIAEATEIKLKKTQRNRSSILKKAEEFYFSYLKSDITTQDLCQEFKISQRTLEYIFKDYYQMSPQKYFKYLRLHALHQELQQKDKQGNLSEIYEQFGFYHRGQLARDYHKLFGEFPSETFRR